MESDAEERFDANESEEEGGFAIGTVVFPLDLKQKDFVDEGAVLIVDADTYLGSFLGKFLSEEIVGATLGAEGEEAVEEEEENEGPPMTPGGQWKVLGTLSEKKKIVPSFLWAVMRNDDYDAYMKEVLKCGVIIYDVTHDQSPQRFAEIRAICDSLRSKWPTFRTRRVFILISSLHSWSNTGSKVDRETEPALDESNYRFRRTHPLYRDLQLLERYVVATGKMTKGMVKAYVVGSGVVYGGEEYCLHHWFKFAWHNSKYLQVYGDGKNRVPTIYIKDLAKIVQNVMESAPPKQRYIIAVDPVVSQQSQIAKAISNVIGTGRLKRCPIEDIYLNKELTTFQADQLLLDLQIKSAFCQENFEIEWSAGEGFPSMIHKLAEEYRTDRNLQPLKIVILGPPGVGKSTLARQISDLYHLHHFTLSEIVQTTRELLKEVAGDQSEPDFADLDTSNDEMTRATASALLGEIDAIDGEVTALSQMGPELVAKIIRFRLLTHPCQNQGFILDGFPESFDQARLIFIAGVDAGEYAAEEEGEDGMGDPVDTRLMPDRVFLLEAPDGFLKDRLASLPITKVEDRHLENNFEQLLAKYREENEVYEKSAIAYFDQQETVYVPIDVVADESPFLKQSVAFISVILGRPRNYGISKEEEEALANAQKFEMAEKEQKELEDLALLESLELDERRNNIQNWIEKLAKVKKEEFEREEAALVPLRNYLMAHVVPTLTRGLIDVSRTRPEDPIDYLAEFLFQNNPGGISPVNPSNLHKK